MHSAGIFWCLLVWSRRRMVFAISRRINPASGNTSNPLKRVRRCAQQNALQRVWVYSGREFIPGLAGSSLSEQKVAQLVPGDGLELILN